MRLAVPLYIKRRRRQAQDADRAIDDAQQANLVASRQMTNDALARWLLTCTEEERCDFVAALGDYDTGKVANILLSLLDLFDECKVTMVYGGQISREISLAERITEDAVFKKTPGSA